MRIPFIIIFAISSLLAQDMVQIPGGTFTIGGGSESDEKPAKEIRLNSFKMDKTPVTNSDYNRCVKSGSCTKAHYSDSSCYIWSKSGLKKTKVPASFGDGDKPVICVSWYQARKYCKAQGKRLPTEAEWEFAATKGGTQKYSWGNSAPTPQSATYKSRSTNTVGAKSAGAYQLKDMNGNVWEWTSDRYERDYYQYIAKENPHGPPAGRFRSIRGGGWYSSASQLRSRNRHWFAPEAGEVSIGFRCVK